MKSGIFIEKLTSTTFLISLERRREVYLTFTFVFIKLMNTLGQMRTTKNGLEAIVASSIAVPTAFTPEPRRQLL